MKVLLISNREPDPQGQGDAKIASQALRGLSSRGIQVRVEHARSTLGWEKAHGGLRSALTGSPLQLGVTASAEFEARVRAAVDAERFDVVVAVHARSARYVPVSQRCRALALIVDSYGLNYTTYRKRVPLPLDAVYRLEARRMARFEVDLVRTFAAVAVVSPADAGYLRHISGRPDRVVHMPYAVDLDCFTDGERRPASAHPVFIFSGRLSYLPNEDAARELIKKVWPVLRARWSDAELRIVGAKPPRRLARLAEQAGVKLLADVPDVRVHLSEGTAALVPMRMGGGVQTKILEAMACGLPVICSSFANAGLAALPEEHLLIADRPQEYVRQVERLLAAPLSARRRTQAAHELVRSRHSPELFACRLLEMCDSIAERGGRP